MEELAKVTVMTKWHSLFSHKDKEKWNIENICSLFLFRKRKMISENPLIFVFVIICRNTYLKKNWKKCKDTNNSILSTIFSYRVAYYSKYWIIKINSFSCHMGRKTKIRNCSEHESIFRGVPDIRSIPIFISSCTHGTLSRISAYPDNW